jgi:hypothetical protein
MDFIRSYFIFLFNIVIIKASFKYYDVKQNAAVNSNFGLSQLIKSFKTLSKMSCLIECNLDYVCSSAAFSKLVSNDNCFLYKTIFNSNELTASNFSQICSKKCKKIKSFWKWIKKYKFFFSLGYTNMVTTFNATNCIDRRKYF